MAAPDSTLITLFLGIIFSIISSLCFAYGIILQKKGVMEMDEIKLSDISSMTAMLKNNSWKWGLVFSLVGGIPYIVTQGLIGVTITQPLTLGLQLAFTVLFAMKILDERLEKIELIGFLILVLSPVFLALGAVTPPDIDISSSIFLTIFLVFILPCILISIIFLLLIKQFNEKVVVVGLLYAIISGIFFAVGAVTVQIGVEVIKAWQVEFFLLAAFFLLGMLAFNASATVIQNLAFQKGKIGIAIGLQGTASMLLAIFGGILIFNQQVLVPIFFILGIILIMTGNILLIRFQTRLEEIEIKKPSLTDLETKISEN